MKARSLDMLKEIDRMTTLIDRERVQTNAQRNAKNKQYIVI